MHYFVHLDSFTKTIDKGTKASAESDGQKQKSQKASKRGLLRGSTSRLDSGSVIATDDDFDSDNTGNNAFELSYDTDTFHNDLLTKREFLSDYSVISVKQSISFSEIMKLGGL